MADINNKILNRFVSEATRPVAESIRDLDADITDMDASYVSTIFPIIESLPDTDVIQDGRSAEGIEPLTILDLKNFITLIREFRTTLNGPGKRRVMRKPVVRVLRR